MYTTVTKFYRRTKVALYTMYSREGNSPYKTKSSYTISMYRTAPNQFCYHMKLHRSKTTAHFFMKEGRFCYHMKLHRSKTSQIAQFVFHNFATIWNYIVLKQHDHWDKVRRYFATIWNYIVLKHAAIAQSKVSDFATIWNYIVLKLDCAA